MPRGSGFVLSLLAVLSPLLLELGADESASPHAADAAEPGAQVAFHERPKLVVQLGHSRNVLAVAYSGDGRTALTGSDDQTARLWDTATGKEIRRFEGHSEPVRSVAISGDAREVCTGSDDQSARLWETATGREIHRFEHFATVTSVAFSTDGKQVLTGGGDGRARLWDAQTGQPLRIFEGHAGCVSAVAFSSDGQQVMTGSDDKTSRLWDAQTARPLLRLEGHSEPVVSVAFSQNGKWLLTGSFDKTARRWDAQTGGQLQVYESPRRVFSAVFSPDGQQVVTGNQGFPLQLDAADQNNTVRVWDTQSGTQVRSFRQYGSSAVAVAVSFDGKQVLVGAAGDGLSMDDGRAQLWDIETGSQLRVFEGQGISSVECVVFSGDGRWLLIGGDDSAARLWDAATGREIHRFQHDPGSITAVAISSDGRRVLTGGNDGTARLWDAVTGKEIRRFVGHAGSVVSVALSPDGKSALTGSADSTARQWDAATGTEVRRLVEYTGRTEFVIPLCCQVAFSPDGRSMLTGQWDNTARLWDAASGKALRSFEGHADRVVSVAFSADGNHVLTGSWDKTARLWNIQTGEPLQIFQGHSGVVSSVAISPDGNRVLTGSGDKTARLWDAQTGTELRSFPGHASAGQSIAFSMGSQRAVMASLDKTAVLWNVETGRQICTLIHCGRGTVAATPEGNYMAPKAALKSVAFGIGNRALPFDQFDLKFNRPDLVLATIGLAPAELVNAYRTTYEKRIAKLGFTEERLGGDFHLPKIALVSQQPFFTQEKLLMLGVRASDSECLLDRVNVDVNGVPLYGAEGIRLRDRNVKVWQQSIEFELSTGKNTIQVSALNDQGAESIKETLEIRCDATAPPPELYVVAVGVSDYRDHRYRLTYAQKDAHDLAELLQSKADRFGQVHVAKFLDREATRDNILKVKKLLLQSRVDDEVVIFFAGHGLLDTKLDYYFATADTDFEDPAKDGLSYAAIESLLDGIRARKKLLLMDTCHSGEVDKESVEVTVADALPQEKIKTRSYRSLQRLDASRLGLSSSCRLLEEMFADLRRGTGAVVIAAAGGAEFALESPDWHNGVFTYAVLNALKTAKADADGDGQIQVSELRDYVMEEVPRLTRGRQTPTVRRENLAIDFPVY